MCSLDSINGEGTCTNVMHKYATEPHLEAEVPDAVATSETVPAEPADVTTARQKLLQKEPVLWRHVASLWYCHLGTPLEGQSTIGPASSLKYKTDDYSQGICTGTFKHSYHEVSPTIMESDSSSLSLKKPTITHYQVSSN
jgi:hypothetical protein